MPDTILQVTLLRFSDTRGLMNPDGLDEPDKPVSSPDISDSRDAYAFL